MMKRSIEELYSDLDNLSIDPPKKRSRSYEIIKVQHKAQCNDPFKIGPVLLCKDTYTQDEVKSLIESREKQLHSLFLSFLTTWNPFSKIAEIVPRWVVGF